MQGIDLFSGAGGMSIGAIMAGIDVQHAVEFDANAAATFKLNHSNTNLIHSDIRQVNAKHLGLRSTKDQSIIFGGPPCQGFSTSNQKNRDFDNGNNWLFKEYLRLVGKVRPNWVVFENVKGLMETESGYFLDAVLKGFKDLGYKTSHFVLNSADYGVPQRRNRLFIVGNCDGIELAVPEPTSKVLLTVKDAISDLPFLENGDCMDLGDYSSPARNKYVRLMRGGLRQCGNHIVTRNARHVVARYKHIPQGGNWECIPKSLMTNYTDVTRCHTGIYRRLKEDEPSVVIGIAPIVSLLPAVVRPPCA